jgi:branched-chain amino acid transport system substrate-binding protein
VWLGKATERELGLIEKGMDMGEGFAVSKRRRSWWRYLLVTLCVAVGSSVLVACGGSDDSGGGDTGAATSEATSEEGSGGTETTADTAENSDEPIVIGAAIGESGWLEATDVPAKVMEEFAIEDINAEGGVLGRPLKLITADTASEQAQGSTAALEVIEQGAEMVIVSCDFDYGSPAALVAQESDKIAFSTCAGSPKFGVQGIGPNAYTMSNGTPALAGVLAEFGYEEKGFRNAYMLLDDTIDYDKTLCAGLEEVWPKLGGKIVGRDTYKNEDASIASQISRLKSTPDVDVIFQCTYNPGGAQALRQLRNAGVDTPVIGSESQDGDYWLNAVPNLSDFYYQTYGSMFGDDPRPQFNQLVKRYTKKVGEPPAQALGFTGYSVIEMYAAAVEKAGTTETAAVREALDEMEDVPLLVGPTTFTPDTHISLHRPMVIMEVQNGKHDYVETRTPKVISKVEY